MSVVHGNDGYVMENGTCVGELNHWTTTINAADLDVSAFTCSGSGSGWGSHTTGLLTWTGTASGFWDFSDAGQQALYTAMTGNNAIEMYFHLNADNYYYGSANISSISIDDTLAGVATVTFNFVGAGELHGVTA